MKTLKTIVATVVIVLSLTTVALAGHGTSQPEARPRRSRRSRRPPSP